MNAFDMSAAVMALLLAEARADAWDEGLLAGKRLAADALSPNPVVHPLNPYRKGGDQ